MNIRFPARFGALFGLVLLVLACAAGVLAAEAAPGEQVVLTIPFENVRYINGSVSVSGPLALEGVRIDSSESYTGTVSEDYVNVAFTGDRSGTLVVTARITEEAAPGAACSVSFRGTAKAERFDETILAGETQVTISAPAPAPAEEPEDPGSAPAEPPPVAERGSEAGPQEPAVQAGELPSAPERTPAPTPRPAPAAAVDRALLEERIREAEAREESSYTPESWQRLASVLENARSLGAGASQTEVDLAEQAITDALQSLRVPDYRYLDGVLAEAKTLLTREPALQLVRLLEAIAAVESAERPGDQDSIDAMDRELREAVEEYEGAITDMSRPEATPMPEPTSDPAETEENPEDLTVTAEQEHIHAPGSLNALLAAVLVLAGIAAGGVVGGFIAGKLRKAKRETDYTPLVEYDIDDDE